MGVTPRTSTLAFDELQFATARLSTKLKVFVAGPQISKEWSGHVWRRRQPSALLRLRTHQLVESLTYESVLGEHRPILRMAEAVLPEVPSVVVSEAFVAATSCDAIIIIPDSPGSFCELASWSQEQAFAEKMLILAHSKYEHEQSYINPHVFSIACDNHACLKWVDYRAWRSAKPIIEQFLSARQQKLFRRDLLRGKHSKS